MRYLPLLPALFVLLSCRGRPAVHTAADKAVEQASPSTYVKVNYQVRKNLLGRKVIEGEVLNAGRFQTYTSVSLNVELTEDGHKTSLEYTVPGKLPPGGRNAFRYKPEGSPEHISIRVSAATAE